MKAAQALGQGEHTRFSFAVCAKAGGTKRKDSEVFIAIQPDLQCVSQVIKINSLPELGCANILFSLSLSRIPPLLFFTLTEWFLC